MLESAVGVSVDAALCHVGPELQTGGRVSLDVGLMKVLSVACAGLGASTNATAGIKVTRQSNRENLAEAR